MNAPSALATRAGWLPAAISALAAGALSAQAEPMILSTYSEAQSRRAFAACDRNADDRISLLEAMKALPGLKGDLTTRFRRLDYDADGFITWPEFDNYYRSRIERGDRIEISPQREVRDPQAPDSASAAAPAQPELDANGDGVITLGEAIEFLRAKGVEERLLSHVKILDTDASGTLSPAELAPVLKVLGVNPGRTQPAVKPGTELPNDLRPADRDGNHVIDRGEFEAALRRLDPALLRWTDRIFRDADRTGNHALGGAEVRAEQPASGASPRR